MADKTVYKIEVHLVHSKLQQIRGKLKYRRNHTPEDFIQDNKWYFEKITTSIRNEYGFYPVHPHWMRAAELIMPGLEPDDY